MDITADITGGITRDVTRDITGGTIGAIGEPSEVEGFALAGVRVCPAGTPDEIRSAWETLTGQKALSDDVVLVILTPSAARVLGDDPGGHRLTVVLPE